MTNKDGLDEIGRIFGSYRNQIKKYIKCNSNNKKALQLLSSMNGLLPEEFRVDFSTFGVER